MPEPIHTLPVQPTPLIGREREVREVRALLCRADVRLVTLTGPGGTGKTRVGLQVAAELIDRFADGVVFVSLAPIGDPDLVTSTIAQALGLREVGGGSLLASLKDYLRTRSLLLVLDNFEQVIAAAPRVAELLAACPPLKVLVTSRAALRLSGEHEYPVPPLELPDPKHLPDLETLSQYDAVSLFIQRARAARPDFQVTNDNAPSVAELCARLDGLPLAIELAAARVKHLTPRALLARLGDRLGLLTGGARDLPARQQTLRGTIDWSYDLLEAGERALFARLAVFVGGCSLEAVEAVCGATEGMHEACGVGALDGLALLVDKSLLRQAEGPDGEPRYGMLETIREYAAERLEASGDAEAVRRRHAEHFLTLAEQAAPELLGPRQSTWLGRLERELDNLRAALGWAIERGEEALGLRLATALGRFWEVRGHLGEGQGWMERALDRWPEAAPAARAAVLSAAGSLAYVRGEYDRAAMLLEESVSKWRALGDQRGLALALYLLGRVRNYQSKSEQAAALYKESLAILRVLGDRRGLALALNGSGVLARDRGDDEQARVAYEESLSIFRELGDNWGIGLLLNNLSRISRDAADWEQTTALCAESLTRFRELGDRHGVSWVLSNLVIVAQRRGAYEQAARLHGAVQALREAVGSTALSLSPPERATYEAAVKTVHAELGECAFATAMAAGRAMPPEQAAATALTGGGPTTADGAEAKRVSRTGSSAPIPEPSPLTRREREVAGLVARGLTDRQIAETLVITEGTVGVHLGNIFSKLDLRSRAQLAVWATEHGLLSVRPS